MEKKQPLSNRAFSVLEVKSLDTEQRIIKGIATTPSVDRVGDIIEPKGIQFKNPMPFLWQHNHQMPIGTVSFSAPTEKGIEFEATIAKIDEPGTLKDRTDEAWQSIKSGLVRAVSIGFRPIEYSFMDNGGVKFASAEVFELSAVTIPANADAVITAIKSIDDEFHKVSADEKPAAIGKGRVVKLNAPARDRADFVIRSIKRIKKND
jgi:uncharacterized protein